MDTEPDSSPEWLTVREVAQALRVSDSTIRRQIESDPTMRVRRIGPGGRIIRIHRSELNRDTSLPESA
jgi:excisionase family DNA binding protein